MNSSKTPTLQQLYAAEKLRARILEKGNARLETMNARLEETKAGLELRLKGTKEQLDIVHDKLDIQEVASEFKEIIIQAKDATIKELQTTLEKLSDVKTDPRLGSGPDSSVMDNDMTAAAPSTVRPKSFAEIWKPLTRPCAARIGNPSNEIMGNPFSHTPGWDLKVALNAGKSGLPYVGLKFKFAKDGIDSKKADHYNSITMFWEPGVRIGGEWMMEHLHVESAASPSDTSLYDRFFPPAIQQLCKTKEQARKMFCMIFKSNVHKTSPMRSDWVKVLGNTCVAPFENLQRMYNATEPSDMVTIWFMSPDEQFRDFYYGCLAPLVVATRDHKPEFHMYPTVDDADALLGENLKLKAENESLRTLMGDRDEKIRILAEDLRKAHKGRDEIVHVAEKINHQQELKPKEMRKALNAILKTLK